MKLFKTCRTNTLEITLNQLVDYDYDLWDVLHIGDGNFEVIVKYRGVIPSMVYPPLNDHIEESEEMH